MKITLIALASLLLVGCSTCPPQKEQLILKVPPELMKKPAPIESL